jgi:nitroimidazol reductase NimA-like FMN-containing flavoprotein (pyridoxamine 5'-phosphate oxidase superfamily)
MSIRLSDDEAWAVLEGSHTGILTTLRADGSPITLPMWFVVRDRTVCFMTFVRTKKIARIANDPRASFLVESGERWAELRAVHLSGRIEPIDDEATAAEVDAALDAKYAAFRTARTELPESARRAYAAKRFFRLVPEPRILTWDNARLGPTRPS